MVDLVTVISYALSFGVPLAILGYGAMIEENKVTPLLAFINFMSFMVYFIYIGAIPLWILITFLLILSLIFAMLYRGVLGGN